MNSLEAWITEVSEVKEVEGYLKYMVKYKYDCYGVISSGARASDNKEELEAIKVGDKILV